MSLEHIDTMIGFTVIMLMFSLLITVLVQMANSLFDLRGKNLLWGVERLLRQMDPALNAHAAELAERIVTHPALAPWSRISYRKSGKARATAIRPGELVKVLKDLARKDSELLPEARASLTALIDPAGAGAAPPEVITRIEGAATELAKALPTEAAVVTDAFARLKSDLGSLESRVANWFDTVMDRTSERFLYHVRVTTAIASLLFAFLLHVDSLQIIRRVGEDHELRAQLVQLANPTLARADTVLGLVGKGKPSGTVILLEMQKAGLAGMPADSIPATLTSRQAGLAWIDTKVSGAVRDSLRASYQQRFATADTLWLRELQWAAEGIDSTLKATSFSPVPMPIPSLASYFRSGFPFLSGHFLGVLISALLLSLGAPFWYNALQTMANLRPVVAQKLNGEASGKG
jgi:hypothetical protein